MTRVDKTIKVRRQTTKNQALVTYAELGLDGKPAFTNRGVLFNGLLALHKVKGVEYPELLTITIKEEDNGQEP